MASLDLLRQRSPWTPDELVALQRRVGPVTLPDICDGCFLHALTAFDRQDRVVRGGEPVSALPADGLVVERVERESADEWSEFLQRIYRLDTGPWLPELIERPGWHQYVAREDGRIVAARGMYIGADGTAWWGMDGPVPGVMTGVYEHDGALCAFMVEDGLARGAGSFIADIEAPSDDMNTPAYEYFGRLGFRRPYVRTHYARI